MVEIHRGRSRDQRLLGFAKQMRREPTPFEVMLWRHLSNSQLGGFKFRRQAVIGTYIVDFLCSSKALIVEVDGDTHDVARDRARDDRLAELGYRVLRFTNAQVAHETEGVLLTVRAALEAASDRWLGRPHPNPSKGRGFEPE